MPLYEYRCQSCQEIFEKLRPMSADDSDVECPSCGSNRVERLLSGFATTSSTTSGGSISSASCGRGRFT